MKTIRNRTFDTSSKRSRSRHRPLPLRAGPIPLAAPLPALRVFAEAEPHACPSQGSLALTITRGEPASPVPGPIDVTATSEERAGGSDAESSPTWRRWESGQVPGNGPCPAETHRWAAHLTKAAIEVLAGIRPAAQLTVWATQEVRTMLAEKEHPQGLCPLRRPRRITVRSVRVTQPTPEVAEACALVSDGQSLKAVALRMQKGDGRWRITAMQIG